ncbi:MAG: ATP-binding protein [Fimbriimonas sp.]
MRKRRSRSYWPPRGNRQGRARGAGSPRDFRVLVGYATAIVGVGLAGGARALLSGPLEERSRYLLFLPCVLFVAWLFGRGPGSLALLLGGVGGIAIAGSSGEPALATPGAWLSLGLYLLSGAIAIGISETQRRTQARVESLNRELTQLTNDLDERVDFRSRELQAVARDLETFTSCVAHDMRTRLRGIFYHCHLALTEDGGRLTPEGRRNLELLGDSATTMSDLIDGLLAYARISGQDLELQRIEMSDLFISVAEEVGQRFDVDFEVRCEPDLHATGDEPLLRSALRCIVDNCVKYRHPDRPLVVEFGRATVGFERRFFVRDNGIGFDIKYEPKLFCPFERLHRDDEYPGVGIGLAIVKKIIERHGGIISGDAEPGVGTRISFRIPVRHDENEDEAEEE